MKIINTLLILASWILVGFLSVLSLKSSEPETDLTRYIAVAFLLRFIVLVIVGFIPIWIIVLLNILVNRFRSTPINVDKLTKIGFIGVVIISLIGNFLLHFVL